ncbi:MAG TPA: twin-arginine translocation signal domain-containing protein, partial [Gemmatimonadetes bacterium]|nr:twin-arginine translocation signal domain-containing protein [Gemmatimonadota bacterium]
MRRRDFLKASAGAVALGALPACASSEDAATNELVPPEFSAWTWVHGGRDYDAAEWQRRFERVREAGITAVLVSGGEIDLV